ncbi:transcriptional regulatory protein [Phlyctema vagabunda]|uniref:Transcriptional regulatory protein n=1 Tax=Phlyctema vagabunda TaxID=108571 RepID=A0ABR4PTS6_9HELO
MESPPEFGQNQSQSSSSSDKKPTRPRQRPGSACEECRRRKLRCDGKQPQCEACFDAGVECVPVLFHSQRGPKRGHLKALQTRMATLEQHLLEAQQQNAQMQQMQCNDILLGGDAIDDFFGNMGKPIGPGSMLTPNAEECPMMSMSKPLDPVPTLFISDLMRSDLDQLYFERTHPFVPILHQRRYFARANQGMETEAQTCLRYAMWTLASSQSAQLHQMRDSLYICTRRMLDSLAEKDNVADVEHVQARLLLLIYDFMRTTHQRGWMGAGYCFRLLQLMRLYEIDSPENVANRNETNDPESWIITEEKRRTFWMAYSLDRFISMRHEWPLTLNEQVIATRLPAPEEEFQSCEYVQMGFLSEAMTSIDQIGSSSFTESIILATICGRALAHRHQSAIEHVYNEMPPQHLQFWDRHEWLDTMLKTRSEMLLLKYPAVGRNVDCLLLFTKMMVHAIVLYLCKVIESTQFQTEEHKTAIAEFKQRALDAAQEIVTLSKSLSHLSFFKVHPFTPLPLVLSVEFFNVHRYLDESVDIQVHEVCETLRELRGVNNLAHDYGI